MAAPAAAAGSATVTYSSPALRVQGMDAVSFRASASLNFNSHSQRAASFFPSIRLAGARRIPKRFQVVSCSAKQETVDRVCEIVKNQLALPEDTTVTGETKFVDIGADSLDTVEIVMGLEEAFQISVDESSAQEIQTVEDAASLIDKLTADKDA